MTKIKCGECGSSYLELVNIKGRKIPWGHNSVAIVIADIEILECQNCHNLIPNGKDIELLATLVIILEQYE